MDDFLKISDNEISKKLVNKYPNLIDGFCSTPQGQFFHKKDNKLFSLAKPSETFRFKSFDDMLAEIRKLRISNYVIFYQVREFEMRVFIIPLSYNLILTKYRSHERNKIIDELLGE
jgi:mRNA-degrading endonuclease RelE of RelBE toxin-antitoxin system